MKVIRDKPSGTWTLVASEETEQQILEAIAAKTKTGDTLGYNGRGPEDGEFCTVRLHAAGHQEDIKKDNITFMGVWVGGIDLLLKGTSRSDKLEVCAIRDTCFFGSGDLIYLGSIEVDNQIAIVATATFCKVCGAAMNDMVACEWKTCDACSAKCQHQWISGAVHGGPAGELGYGQYCAVCGRGKPKAEGEPEMSQLEQHLAVEREYGFQIVYKETGLTPKMVAHLQEVAKKWNQSR